MRAFSVSRTALVLVIAIAAVAVAAPPEVQTEYGRIRGVEELSPDVAAFYGIPYAAPPVGMLRFTLPQPPTPWNTTRDCTRDEYTHVCPQFHVDKKIVLGQEDCLYMNIFVPKTAKPGENLPVLFWIYGGGYIVGDGYEFGWYRGKNLAARRNVIVVEFNYRLSALGFLSHPTLKSENVGRSTGNYALQDQQAAMEFVYRNIENFGGDKSKITIFGESAGAFSVCWHLVSEISKSFFSAAIMESGTCESAEFFVSLNRSYLFSQEVLQYIGCNYTDGTAAIACARAKPFTDLFLPWENAWPMHAVHPPIAPVMPFGPTIDGSSSGLLARPITLINAGRFARVPVILGTNKDEGTLFIPGMPLVVPGAGLPLDEKGIEMVIGNFFNATATTTILSMYPLTQFKSQDARGAAILRDFFFTCTSRITARALSQFGDPVYLYQFTQALDNWVDYDTLGDYHTLELPFVFDHQWPPLVHVFTEKERKLSDSFTLYWSNLARYSSPNGELGPDDVTWPVYNATSDMNVFMEVPVKTGSRLNGPLCDFWTTMYSKYYFDN